MTSLGQLGLEIVVDAASKLENNGVSMFGIFILLRGGNPVL